MSTLAYLSKGIVDDKQQKQRKEYRSSPIFSFFLTVYLALTIIWATLLMLGATVVYSSRPRRARATNSVAARCVRHILALSKGWKVNVHGLEKLLSCEQFIIVANHQSVVDPFLLLALEYPVRIVAKKWIFKIPVLGSALQLSGHIPIQTKEGLRECRKALAAEESLLIFAEGTRSEDGLLQSFKPGAFRLAAAFNVPILPIVIEGSRQILPKNEKTFRVHANVHVHILDPVSPTVFDCDPEQLRSHVHNKMAEEIDLLRAKEHSLEVGNSVERTPPLHVYRQLEVRKPLPR